jgi:ABC-type polysaccharide/polyol phosphate export permease
MTLTLVLGIGLNYAVLLHQPVNDFLPFVAIGLVMWGFVSAGIAEGGDAFVAGGSMIKQSSIPLPLFTLRVLLRSGINLAHQVVIIVGVMLWFHVFPGVGVLWALPGLAIMVVNLGWLGLLLAMLSARFRDVPQIVSAVLQVVFFLSPIFWTPSAEMKNNPLVAHNPFYFSIESIRTPLLHGTMPHQVFGQLVPIAVIGWIGTILVYNQTRRRVVHYL